MQLPAHTTPINSSLSVANESLTNQKPQYPKLDEIIQTFASAKFTETTADTALPDRWKPINCFRDMVSLAVNQGLSEVISRYAKEGLPIVEIGSGIGYTFSDALLRKMVRTQPHTQDCTVFHQATKEQIYQIDIQGIHQSFVNTCQKISLFVALNVFDTLSADNRKASYKQIAQIQGLNDHLLILNDTNPHIDTIFDHLGKLHPECAIFPYMPLSTTHSRLSAVLIPVKLIKGPKPTADDFVQFLLRETLLRSQGLASGLSLQLNELKEELNLSVICLEDFFIEQVKSELKESGYEATVHYHASFVPGSVSSMVAQQCTEDLLYKFVSDTKSTVRQWNLSDKNFLTLLAQKGLSIPPTYDDAFLAALKEKGQKILGAEILVIAAKKINP